MTAAPREDVRFRQERKFEEAQDFDAEEIEEELDALAADAAGEPEASKSLRDAIDRELGRLAVVPSYRERVRVDRPPPVD